jgi:hypothetical protein
MKHVCCCLLVALVCNFGFSFQTHAQADEARTIITKLTQPSFGGRGYVKHGDKKAAKFIQSYFVKLGLQPVSGTYVQHFNLAVNTFPKKMNITVDGSELNPGIDYIVNPASGGCKRKYALAPVDTMQWETQLLRINDTCWAIPQSFADAHRQLISSALNKKKHGAVMFLEEKKLTWSVSNMQFAIPVLTVIKTAMAESSKQIYMHIDARFESNYKSQNVMAMVPGSGASDTLIVVTAHYDHLGRMGNKTIFHGANDNASGTSMMLTLADHYIKPENKPKYNILFIAFGGEEAGLIGSEYYVQHPLLPLKNIRFLINLDLLGTGDEGIMVVNATEFKQDFEKLKSINAEKNYVTEIKARGKARNSDHYFFSEAGVPSFFVYTLGGVTFYHDVLDKAETLPLTKFNEVFALLCDFINQF